MGITHSTKANSRINQIVKQNPSKYIVNTDLPGRGKPGKDTSITHVSPEYNKKSG